MAQLVKRPSLDFGSCHDLAVCEFKPCIGLYTDSAEPAWDSLSLPLSLPLPHSLTLSLSLNKYFIYLLKKKLGKEFGAELVKLVSPLPSTNIHGLSPTHHALYE